MKTPLIIAPSILSADFACLGDEVKNLASAGADWIHLDVMDGNFVPNLTFGAPTIKAIRGITGLPFDVHLMVEKPLTLLGDYVAAGADHITIHAESDLEGCTLAEALQLVRSKGVKSGVSIKPNTPLSGILTALQYADILLIMTVEPGFGGQSFMMDQLEKVRQARIHIQKHNLPTCIQVDGGVNENTIKVCADAGADCAVAGSAVLSKVRTSAAYRQNIMALHKASGV